MPLSSKLTRSIVINAHAEKIWTILKAFGGNEKFNPLVTSSKVDAHGEGSKRTCYVSMDGGKFLYKCSRHQYRRRFQYSNLLVKSRRII